MSIQVKKFLIILAVCFIFFGIYAITFPSLDFRNKIIKLSNEDEIRCSEISNSASGKRHFTYLICRNVTYVYSINPTTGEKINTQGSPVDIYLSIKYSILYLLPYILSALGLAGLAKNFHTLKSLLPAKFQE